ncbi:MAG: BamA/TamA family outer membrane protein, partial [Byssovorax sp.]
TPKPTVAASSRQAPKRALPDYAGRAPAGTTVGEALLWIPRVLFFPAYVVTDFVVRRPLGALTGAVEGSRWIAGPEEDSSSGEDHSIGISPTLRFDTDFRPTVGAYFHYDHFVAEGSDLRVHAAFGGTDWLRLTVGDRLALSPRAALDLRLEGTRRPDFIFHGVGPRSLAEDRSRYASDYVDGSVSFDVALPHGLSAKTYVGLKAVSFGHDTCCEEPSLLARVAQGRFAAPAGFAAGYTGVRTGGRLVYDSRPPRPAPGAGLRLEGNAEYAADVRAPGASGWVRYGASAGGYLTLRGKSRVLSLAGTVLFADPVGARDLPFTELVALGGGSGPMRGFHKDRLLGRSAAALSLEYRWPIWALLDTSLQLSLGNVFDAHLANLAARDLRLAFAAGIHTVSEINRSFELLFGGGTQTFAQGGHVRELRLVAGLNQKF